MSELHVRQIKANLERTFRPVIDTSDVASRSSDEQQNSFLTRALAAMALAYIGNITPNDAAGAVTDGGQDNGLDAVLYHQKNRIVYLVQSKWRHDGSGSIDRAGMQKFLKGLRDLLNARWDRFNARIRSRASMLDSALDDASTRIALIVATTGQEPISNDVRQDLEDVLNELNDPTELVTHQLLRQADLYAAVAQGLEGAPIDIDVALYDWGQVREPYAGFYGQVAASDLAQWLSNHQSRLFTPNIRMFLGGTEVNEGMQATLQVAPQDFWYFNNGITALCRTIRKKPIGGNTRETGVFECHDLRIVNGAQTCGAIAQAHTKCPDEVAKARVAIRLIELEHTPQDFDRLVTRYNNTQNRIDRRDFVALDVEHERIRGELQLDGVTYAYKSGEPSPSAVTGFDLVEATVARACVQPDVALSVQAKREIGKLWEDLDKAPYKVLFNASVSGPDLWRSVQAVRQVEQTLAGIRSGSSGRERLLSIHGNRFIAHMTLSSHPWTANAPKLSSEDEAVIRERSESIFKSALAVLNRDFSDAYLASLFKNASKCQALKSSVEASQV
jgi:hypothetical protein